MWVLVPLGFYLPEIGGRNAVSHGLDVGHGGGLPTAGKFGYCLIALIREFLKGLIKLIEEVDGLKYRLFECSGGLSFLNNIDEVESAVLFCWIGEYVV